MSFGADLLVCFVVFVVLFLLIGVVSCAVAGAVWPYPPRSSGVPDVETTDPPHTQWTAVLSGGTLNHIVVLAVIGVRQPMWWWILAIVAVFVVLIVVLQRRGSGSGDPRYVSDQPYGSGPSTPPSHYGPDSM